MTMRTVSTDEREAEFKLRSSLPLEASAIDRVLGDAGLRATATTVATHVDSYLDDARRSLLRRGIGLRLRRGPDGSVLTVKLPGERRGALHVRREFEAPWSGEAPVFARDLPMRLRDAVEPFLLDRPLESVVLLEVQRQGSEVFAGDALLGELALDRVVAHRAAGDRTVTFHEVELEVRGDMAACGRLARHLLERASCTIAIDDKLAWSLRALDVPVPPLRPVALPSRPQTLGDRIAAAMQSVTERLLWAESRVRLDGSAAAVHDLRVCLRRLRVLVRACRAAWPDADQARTELALTNASRELNGLRERDVLQQRVPSALRQLPPPLPTAHGALIALLHTTRDALLQRGRESLRSPGHREDLARLEALGQRASMLRDVADRPVAAIGDVLRAAVRTARRSVRQLGPGTPHDELHRTRLRLKRVRILGEELGTADRGKTHRRLVRAIGRLGTVCDHEAAALHYLRLLEQEPLPSPAVAALLGGLATLDRAASPAARRAALAAVARLDRRRCWRRLRRAD